MDNTATCNKVTGSCTCFTGWQNETCNINIDECTITPNLCNDTLKTCVDTQGSYQCDCTGGYILDGSSVCIGAYFIRQFN